MTQGTRRFIWGLFLIAQTIYFKVNSAIPHDDKLFYSVVNAIVISLGIYHINKSFKEL